MLSIVVIVLSLIADRLAKLWAASELKYYVNGTTSVIPGIVRFTYVENTGAAFGILGGQTLLITLVALVASGIIIFEIIRHRKMQNRLYVFSLSLLLAGALGNLFDRISLGYVVDFIEFTFIKFAVFNIADICVTFGVILLIIYLFFADRPKKQALPLGVTDESAELPQDDNKSALSLFDGKESDPEFEAMVAYYRKQEIKKGKAESPVPNGAQPAVSTVPLASAPESPAFDPKPSILQPTGPAIAQQTAKEKPVAQTPPPSRVPAQEDSEPELASMSRMQRRANNKKKK